MNAAQSPSTLAKQPFYLRSTTYLYPKASSLAGDNVGSGLLRSTSKYAKSVDIDDDDIQVTTRHGSRYSSSSCKFKKNISLLNC
jgi:hypothetical protein